MKNNNTQINNINKNLTYTLVEFSSVFIGSGVGSTLVFRVHADLGLWNKSSSNKLTCLAHIRQIIYYVIEASLALIEYVPFWNLCWVYSYFLPRQLLYYKFIRVMIKILTGYFPVRALKIEKKKAFIRICLTTLVLCFNWKWALPNGHHHHIAFTAALFHC